MCMLLYVCVCIHMHHRQAGQSKNREGQIGVGGQTIGTECKEQPESIVI